MGGFRVPEIEIKDLMAENARLRDRAEQAEVKLAEVLRSGEVMEETLNATIVERDRLRERAERDERLIRRLSDNLAGWCNIPASTLLVANRAELDAAPAVAVGVAEPEAYKDFSKATTRLEPDQLRDLVEGGPTGNA